MLPALLLTAPLLVLLVPLALGRYPGERLVTGLATRRPPSPDRLPRGRRRRRVAHRPVLRILPRGGCLLADPIAGRGPPRVGWAGVRR